MSLMKISFVVILLCSKKTQKSNILVASSSLYYRSAKLPDVCYGCKLLESIKPPHCGIQQQFQCRKTNYNSVAIVRETSF